MISPSLAEPPTPHFTFKNFPSASKSPVVPRKPVTNVTAFGAFVDVGVHQDGLVHVSRLGKRAASPFEVVRVGQWVTVAVREVDLPRRRIALSMRQEDLEGTPPEDSSSAPRL